MQRMGKLSDWVYLPQGTAIKFPVERAKRVRLEIVTPMGTDWYIAGSGKGEYLTTTSGRDVIELEANKDLCIVASSSARYRTSTGAQIHIDETGNPIFTKIANRQPRNLELERAVALASRNTERRMEAMHNEVMRRIDQDRERYRGEIDPQTGEFSDNPQAGAADDARVSEEGVNDTSDSTDVDRSGDVQPQATGGQSDELSDSNATADK